MRLWILLISLPIALAACAFGYQARGQLSDVPGELRGKAYPGSTLGGGRFSLSDREGRLACDGEIFPASNASSTTCDGERGEGVMRCNDGRVVKLRWQALSCRAWQGDGEDAKGNHLEFRAERLPR